MFENYLHIILLSLSLITLINAFYSKNILFQIASIGFLFLEYLRIKDVLSSGDILHISCDLIVLSILAYGAKIMETKFGQLIYIFVALFVFGSTHSHFPINDSTKLNIDQDAEILVLFDSKESLLNWKNDHDQKYDIIYPLFNPADHSFQLDEYLAINLTPDQHVEKIMKKLESNPIIIDVEYNDVINLSSATYLEQRYNQKQVALNDPLVDRQWTSSQFELDKFHERLNHLNPAQAGKTIIAILDTGIDVMHEDLKDNCHSINKRHDNDPQGHGTHCAGLAAAVTGNNIGISSFLPGGLDIKVSSVKIMNFLGFGTQASIINGMIEAADAGANVISLSLGRPSTEDIELAYEEAVKYVNDKGAIVVISAGNSSMDARNYSPANTKGVICVAAINQDLEMAYFSNHVRNIEMGIAAPGMAMLSTMPKNKYEMKNGTSMSAPYVAGIIAILKHYNPQLTTKQIYTLIRQSAINRNGIAIIDPNRLMDLFLQEST